MLESKTHSWKGDRREMEQELENRRLDCAVVAATETMAILISRFSVFSSSSSTIAPISRECWDCVVQ